MRKEIDGYDVDYSVDDSGNIYGKRGGILKPYDNGYGYLVVDLKDRHGRKRHRRVHRLAAETLLPNPSSLSEINHKDENKYNNALPNLEWCTSSYNKRYGSGRKSRSDGMKKVWESRRADNG